MSQNKKNLCTIGIAPSSRGFGFAVFDGDMLVDWGIKTAEGDKNRECLRKFQRLIRHYKPCIIVLEDASAKGSRRYARIRSLTLQMVATAKKDNVRVRLFSRQHVRKILIADGKGNKDAVAQILAKRFPEELGFRLPRKRRLWDSEAYQMGIFDAVAVALMVHESN